MSRGYVSAGPRNDLAAEALLAAAVAAVSIGGHQLAAGTDAVTGAPDVRGHALLAVGAMALFVRRRLPLVTLWVTAAGVAATLAAGIAHEGPFVILPLMVALYSAADAGRRMPAVAAATVVIATFGLTLALLPTRTDTSVEGLLWAAGWLTAALVTGEVVRSRRDYLGEVEARAADAERTREEEGRRRAGEERLRIARELHDVLGHSLSLINVQAGTAAHVIDRHPDKAHEALETIRQTSGQALHELRGTLGAFDQDGETPSRTPAPSLDRLDELVRPVSAAGVDVQVSTTGVPRDLPAAVGLAAYRIVQESLTNVLRHGAGATATVRLGYGDRDLTVEVADTGDEIVDQRLLGAGNGIAGMRERAIAMGGELEVVALPEGGVHVRARLPLKRAHG